MGKKQTAPQRVLIVTDSKSVAAELAGIGVTTADAFLEDDVPEPSTIAAVVNLCRGYQYLSKGYYVSLVADARDLRAFPSLDDLDEISNPYSYLRALQEIDVPTVDFKVLKGRKRVLPRVIAPLDHKADRPGAPGTPPPPPALKVPLVKSHEKQDVAYVKASQPAELVEVNSVFGRTPDRRFRDLCERIFTLYQFPILKVRFFSDPDEDEGWAVAQLMPGTAKDLDAEERALLIEELGKKRFVKTPEEPEPEEIRRRSIACLYDEDDDFPPSNDEAIDKFERVAHELGVRFERIGREDLERLSEFDALFIRACTALDRYTFQFAQAAESLNIPVIDDAESIIKCSNKVYLHELFRRYNIPTPRTVTVTRSTEPEDLKHLGYPLIVKMPDGTFSVSVKKAKTWEEFDVICREMFKRSPLLIAQEYLPTEFDWRIGVLEGQALFAAKYFMAPGHWQIASRAPGRPTRFGRVQAVPLEEAPPEVLRVATAGAALIGEGLYGVDLKQIGDRVVIIEINDNPNLDAGNEDAAEGDSIYRRILETLIARMPESVPVFVPYPMDATPDGEAPIISEVAAVEEEEPERREFDPK